jgi:ABC-type microcin C transport system permease subunit YejB
VLAYFAKRLALILPTFLGITMVLFLITRIVPGGPLEQAINERIFAGGEGGRSTAWTSPLSRPTCPGCGSSCTWTWEGPRATGTRCCR